LAGHPGESDRIVEHQAILSPHGAGIHPSPRGYSQRA
jgi:hypothetical protein